MDNTETSGADPDAVTAAGAQPHGATQSDTGRGTVFHFSRDGRRLWVKPEGQGNTGPATALPVDSPDHAWPSARGLLAVSGAVTELFATLAEDEKLSPPVAEVVDSMRCLAAKLEEKKRLEEELAAVAAQIVIVEQVLHRHVREARDSEIKALEVCQARVQLMRELADSILGDKGAQKPA